MSQRRLFAQMALINTRLRARAAVSVRLRGRRGFGK